MSTAGCSPHIARAIYRGRHRVEGCVDREEKTPLRVDHIMERNWPQLRIKIEIGDLTFAC